MCVCHAQLSTWTLTPCAAAHLKTYIGLVLGGYGSAFRGWGTSAVAEDPRCCGGPTMAKPTNVLGRLMEDPDRPLAP